MKYFVAVFVTAVLVFLGATIFYKGIPKFPQFSKDSVTTESTPTPTDNTFETPQASPSASPLVDDPATVAAAIKIALVAEHGSGAELMDVTVSKIEGNYAKGMASEEGGGGLWFGAKVNGVWKLVFDGNGVISCEEISPYPDFPKDLIPSCWDMTTDKLVTR